MARRFTRPGRNFKTQRETLWVGSVPTRTSLGAASTAALILSASAGLLALRPFTVVRTRGFMTVRSDQVAANEVFGVSVAKMVVSDQASAIGVTAVPTPDADIGSDLFFVYETILSEFQFNATGNLLQNQPFVRIDSKAMRRVDDDQDLVTVIETPAIVSSGLVMYSDRVLIKLH